MLPPGLAWATRSRSARLATKLLRAIAVVWVTRRTCSGKEEITNSRPVFKGAFQSGGRRMSWTDRAGQTITGDPPRKTRRKHSCSIGE